LYGASPVKRYGFSDEKNHSVISHNLGCIPCGKKFCKLRNGAYSPCMDGIKPDDIMKILEEDNILPLKQK
jgi:ADP-heptose:LPS heptosyltransferase